MKNIQQITDEELVRQFQAGTITAWNRLYEKYFPIATNVANSIVFNDAVAQDIAQDALINACSALQKPLFILRVKFYTWLYRVIINKTMDHFRSNKQRFLLQQSNMAYVSDTNVDIERTIHYDFVAQHLRKIFETLPPKKAKALYLRAQGMPYYEICIELDESISVVKSAIHQSRKTMSQKTSFKNLVY